MSLDRLRYAWRLAGGVVLPPLVVGAVLVTDLWRPGTVRARLPLTELHVLIVALITAAVVARWLSRGRGSPFAVGCLQGLLPVTLFTGSLLNGAFEAAALPPGPSAKMHGLQAIILFLSAAVCIDLFSGVIPSVGSAGGVPTRRGPTERTLRWRGRWVGLLVPCVLLVGPWGAVRQAVCAVTSGASLDASERAEHLSTLRWLAADADTCAIARAWRDAPLDSPLRVMVAQVWQDVWSGRVEDYVASREFKTYGMWHTLFYSDRQETFR